MKYYQFRQGDLLLERIKRIPPQATPQMGRVLAQGEATGHAHILDSGKLSTYGGNLYFRLARGGTVRHDEHGPIKLPRGDYRVVRQREYAPTAPRWVAD